MEEKASFQTNYESDSNEDSFKSSFDNEIIDIVNGDFDEEDDNS